MNKDRALIRAFQLVETLDLTGLTALQVVRTVNTIADELQEVYAEGLADKTKEQEAWKGLGANVKTPHQEDKLRATWPIQARTPEDLSPGEMKTLDPAHEWYPKIDLGTANEG